MAAEMSLLKPSLKGGSEGMRMLLEDLSGGSEKRRRRSMDDDTS